MAENEIIVTDAAQGVDCWMCEENEPHAHGGILTPRQKAAAFDTLNAMRAVAISITRSGSVFVQDYRVKPSRAYSTETLAEAAVRIAEDTDGDRLR